MVLAKLCQWPSLHFSQLVVLFLSTGCLKNPDVYPNSRKSNMLLLELACYNIFCYKNWVHRSSPNKCNNHLVKICTLLGVLSKKSKIIQTRKRKKSGTSLLSSKYILQNGPVYLLPASKYGYSWCKLLFHKINCLFKILEIKGLRPFLLNCD